MGSSTGRRPQLLLLSRPGCHLCEEFREALEAAFPGRFDLREVSVDVRPDWHSRFGAKIPVLLARDGALICESFFDAGKLARWVAAGKHQQA